MLPEIRFATSRDGVRIAWSQHGDGPPLVRVGTWLTHLQYDWESVVWRHWLTELGDRFRFVRYDDRGCGLSDREVPGLGLEAWIAEPEGARRADDVELQPAQESFANTRVGHRRQAETGSAVFPFAGKSSRSGSTA